MAKFIQTPRGTRDLVGEDAETFEYLVNEFRRIARLNGFKPIVTPTIEFFELFSRKSGEEIIRSMYVFKDKAGRLLALRPEVTASIVRAYLRNLLGEPKPILLYYVSQCFRYEEPQRGRYREFWQLGLEVIGERDRLNSDLRVVYTIYEYLESLGIGHWFVAGNVGIYRAFMDSLGISEDDQDHVLHLIDKDLVDDVREFLAKRYGVEAVEVITGLMNRGIDGLRDYVVGYKDLLGERYEAVMEYVEDTQRFITYSRELGLRIEYMPKLVRGLAYYTGLIYEVKAEGLDISIGGGGRYDNLTLVYGGSPEYMTGAALGLDRIMLVLKRGAEGSSARYRVIVILIKSDLEGYRYAYDIVKELHRYGVEAPLYTGKPSKILSLASRRGYTHAIFIGSREVVENRVTIKDLSTGEQVVIDKNRLIEYLNLPP